MSYLETELLQAKLLQIQLELCKGNPLVHTKLDLHHPIDKNPTETFATIYHAFPVTSLTIVVANEVEKDSYVRRDPDYYACVFTDTPATVTSMPSVPVGHVSTKRRVLCKGPHRPTPRGAVDVLLNILRAQLGTIVKDHFAGMEN